MFRVANVEFIPEYRQAESHEFVSMANKIQHVVGYQCNAADYIMVSAEVRKCSVYRWCLVGKQCVQDVSSVQTLQASRHFRPQVLLDCQLQS